MNLSNEKLMLLFSLFLSTALLQAGEQITQEISALTSLNNNSGVPLSVYGHYSTWHDGGVATLLDNGSIVALSAERVGDRYKHSFDSRLAYDHLSRFYDFTQAKEIDYCFKVDRIWDIRESNNHHLYHAAGTFFGSGFSDAGILVVDGQGPDLNDKIVATSIFKGQNSRIKHLEDFYSVSIQEKFIPQSIGHFYTAISAMAGMQNLHEEGKTMGLAAYGDKNSKYFSFIKEYVYSREDGTFFIEPNFIKAIFSNTYGPKFFADAPIWKKDQPIEVKNIWQKYLDLRGKSIRTANEAFSKDDMDIAAVGQAVLEEIMLGLVHRTIRLSGSKNLCLAGGVALNSSVNGKIAKFIEEGILENLYIIPSAGDDGQAIGKLFLNTKLKNSQIDLKIANAYFGPPYNDQDIQKVLQQYGSQIDIEILSISQLIERTAEILANSPDYKERIIAWYRGRSELGPRALGHRSILADPRHSSMRDYINKEVKNREWYRPLAPAVLQERMGDFFDLNIPSPFMLIVSKVLENKRCLIPAVTHVDGTARLQTVTEDVDSVYYNLIKHFDKLTCIPLLLNTSFNAKDEPIVETPEDAVKSFLKMEKIPYLVIENYLITRKK